MSWRSVFQTLSKLWVDEGSKTSQMPSCQESARKPSADTSASVKQEVTCGHDPNETLNRVLWFHAYVLQTEIQTVITDRKGGIIVGKVATLS